METDQLYIHYNITLLSLNRISHLAVMVINWTCITHQEWRNWRGTVMEMVQDVLDCVLWIKENACAFNIHKENIVLMGHSAGAHLCALSVLLLAEESSELNIDHVKQRDLLSSIKAVVGLSGVYHILDHYLHETWRGIEYLSTMCKAMKDPDYFDHYSPTLLISSLRAEKLTRLPAFVLLHGTKDNVVPVKSTLKFSEALTLAAVKVALYILPNISHTEIVTDLMAENRRYYLAIFGCIKQEVNLLTTSY
ncbi:IMCE methylesterase, partial [Polypterus senegalus]|nr:IMCE methylesterase [Polypterus senegalus]